MGAKLIFLITLILLGIFLLTKTGDLDSETQSSIDMSNGHVYSHVIVTGIGLFNFVSEPLSEGPFKPKIIYLEEGEESIFWPLVNIMSGQDYEGYDYYTQRVVFSSPLAVLNKDILAKTANVQDCKTYSVMVNKFLSGITIIYNCSPEM